MKTVEHAPAVASGVDPEEVSRRVEAFGRTGDPAALWPGLTESERVEAARELERLTRDILIGRQTARIRDGLTPYALGVAGHTTGMGPVVGRWIEDGRVIAHQDVARTFAEHLEHGRLRAARIEHELSPALDALVRRGIPVVALKGFHTARVYYEETAMRRLSDVDLLIPPDRIADAEATLISVGFRSEGPAHRPYKRDWIGPDVDPRFFSVERVDVRTRWALELHTSLDRVFHAGAVARLDRERGRTEDLSVMGHMLRGLSAPLLLVYLACHCSQELQNIRLLRLYEMVRVIRAERTAGRSIWPGVQSLLERTESAAFVYPALSLVEDLAPGSVEARVLDFARAASTSAARHTVRRLAPAGGSLDERGVLRQLMWTRGPAAIGQRVFRILWPASLGKPGDVIPGWRARLRRLRGGILTVAAPDERTCNDRR